VTRFGDAPLAALALEDDAVASWLIDAYARPLDRDGNGKLLRETLYAYFESGYNAASAAAALGVDRTTVRDRLAKIENRLGCSISKCHVELDTALRLDELRSAPSGQAIHPQTLHA
jgi:DNA-binding PucR family transcriptional regulator